VASAIRRGPPTTSGYKRRQLPVPWARSSTGSSSTPVRDVPWHGESR